MGIFFVLFCLISLSFILCLFVLQVGMEGNEGPGLLGRFLNRQLTWPKVLLQLFVTFLAAIILLWIIHWLLIFMNFSIPLIDEMV